MLRTVPKISCSLLAAREKGFDLPSVVKELPSLGVDMIHFDISDDTNSLNAEELAHLQPMTRLPFDIHLSVSDPMSYASRIDLAVVRRERSDLLILEEEVCQLGRLRAARASPTAR